MQLKMNSEIHTNANIPELFLQTKNHEELLNVIDHLRSIGLSHYVPLPQIIVSGDQSSGKSAVLNAVLGVRFPTKDNLCTRFATELILRRDSDRRVTISIIPGAERTEEEKTKLLAFQPPTFDVEEFPTLVEAAKEAMGLNSDAKAFTDDILSVEISGPDQPNLTLVDLPGMIHSQSKQQSTRDVELVSSMVRSYMSNTRSIILAVVSAGNDYANQVVTRLAREVDPKGRRTLGIITKPDLLPEGSDSEKSFASLAKNEDVVFRLGWHVLRNRGYDDKDCSAEQRDEKERRFFSEGIWEFLPTNILGVGALKPRLSAVLTDQVVVELPSLIKDVKNGIEDCQDRLTHLGQPRVTLEEQKFHLVQTSWKFSSLIKGAVDGIYGDEFFGDAKTYPGYNKRLRAVVQNLLLEFAEEIRLQGHTVEIVEADSSPQAENFARKQISRSDFTDEVAELMKRSRGRELPGTFNPLIISDLFFQQALPWKNLAQRYCEKILSATRLCLELIMNHVADEDTSDGLLREIIDPAIERYVGQLDEKIAEIVRPHQRGHAITYNHYFTETIQKARQDHAQKQQARRLNEFFNKEPDTAPFHAEYKFNTADLLRTLNSRTEVDMDRFASSEAVFCMEAYHKVAMKVFVDNFAALGIEYHLLATLSDIFAPGVAMSLSEDLTAEIAAETEDSALDRTRTTKKLHILKDGLQKLSRFGRQMKLAHNTKHISDKDERDDEQSSISGVKETSNNNLDEEEAVEIEEPAPPVESNGPEVDEFLFWSSSTKKSRKKVMR